ncbi:MAG: hypothetical protein GIKADHBN_02532 [Phycisphaerales bacterium]|nr:hypothetical protein [Phycisphaerales bacterium]
MKNKSNRSILLVIGSLVAAAALAACNTVEGAGKDIKSGGQAVENAAASNK